MAMKNNIQLSRQAVSTKAILDFSVMRIPELPESVARRFPELRATAQQLDQLRINLQMQLREQFVAIREMLDKVVTIERLETFRETLTNEILKIEKEITIISQVASETEPPGTATDIKSGLVKTDKLVPDPVVYLASTVDDLIASIVSGGNTSITNIVNELTTIQSQVDTIIGNAIPLIVFENTGENPIFPPIQGILGIFGPQRAVNIADGAFWTCIGGANWAAG